MIAELCSKIFVNTGEAANRKYEQGNSKYHYAEMSLERK